MEDQDYSTGFGTLTLPLSLPESQTHRENSQLLWRFQYFQNCITDAAEVLYQEFWSVWLFTSPHKSRVIRATLQAKAFYHLSRKQLENFFTKFQYIQDDEISLKPPQQHSQQTQNHKELWWKVTLPPHVCWNSQLLGFSWWLIQRKTWCTIYPGHLVRLWDVNQHGSLDMHQFTPQSHTESWGTCLYWGEAVSQNNYKRQGL